MTTVIPGARSVAHAKANVAGGELPPLGEDFMAGVREAIRPGVKGSDP